METFNELNVTEAGKMLGQNVVTRMSGHLKWERDMMPTKSLSNHGDSLVLWS